MTTCVICCDTIAETDDSRETRLECGHTFHVSCIVNWFRLGKASCPCCRDDPKPAVVYTSEIERFVDISHRRRNTLPSNINSQFNRLDSWKTKEVQAYNELKDLRRTQKAVFKKERDLIRRRHSCIQKQRRLKLEIGRMPMPGIPMVQHIEPAYIM